MVAVSNTSPISNLALIDRLDLLRSQFSLVWVPEAVKRELGRIPSAEASGLVDQAIRDGWLRSRSVVNAQLVAALTADLDAGEAEAIALACEMEADLLLMDEKEGRVVARQAGVAVRGVLGVLLRAKIAGELPLVRPEIEALRSRAGFYIAATLESEILRSASEH